MNMFGRDKKWGHVGNAGSRVLIAGATAVLLTSCNSTGGNETDNNLGVTQQAEVTPPKDESKNLRAFCPRTVIRAGTETLRTFEEGIQKDDPGALNSIRFQSTITEVARECNYSPTNLNLKVGVKGRVINGPTGTTGNFTVPVRIAIVNTSKEVLYSQLHQVPVTIPEGGSNARFRFVDNAINLPVPEKPNLTVFVGFDEGPPEGGTVTQ